MRICVFEDRAVELLEPLTLTRPAFDLTCGAVSLFQHQQRFFLASEAAVLVRPELVDLCRLAHPDLAINEAAPFRGTGAVVLVNARWLPPAVPIAHDEASRVGLVGSQVAYVVLPANELEGCNPETLAACLTRWQTTLAHVAAGGWLIQYPWNLIERLPEALCRWSPEKEQGTPPPLTLVGPSERLFVDPSAEVEPFVVALTTGGPVIIEREAKVKAFSRLEGPCYIGPGTWLNGAKVACSSVGPVCRIGGEVEASIVHGHSNKAHEGFLGHSYIGEWVNLAAGTQACDLRNDYRPVTMIHRGSKVETGLTKVGAFLGDHAKTGINTLLNTGTNAGAFCQIFQSSRLPPRYLPSFSSFAQGELREEPDVTPLFATAATVMKRRGLELTDTHRHFFLRLHERTARERAKVVGQASLPPA